MLRKLWISLALGAIGVICIGWLRSAEQSSVKGVVKSASGTPIAGALVTAGNDDQGFSVTVVSQEGGRYAIPHLPAGKYLIHSVGGGLQSDGSLVDVTNGSAATKNLSMGEPADPRTSASMSEYATQMPESEAKDFIVGNCTDCHKNGLQEILYSRKSEADWDATVEKMKNHPYGYFRSLEISDPQKAKVVQYLSTNFGTDAPQLDPAKFPKTLYTGAAAKVVVTEFNLPSGGGAHDITIDSHGIAWIGEGGGHGVLGRLDPQTLKYTRIPIPGDKPAASALAVDPKGRVWFSDGRNSRLVAYDPKSNAFTSFDLPKPPTGGAEFNTIRFERDNTVWGTEIGGNQVIRLDPATKKVDQFVPPFAERTHKNASPYGMAIAPNGTVWFVEGQGERVTKVDPSTGNMTEFEVPSHAMRMRRMASDGNGDIWFGEFSVSRLGMADAHTDEISEYLTPTKNSGPYSIDVDKSHNLIWVDEMMADQIASFDPRTKTFVEYPMATRTTSTRRIEVDPSRPTRIWYSAFNRDKVGFMDVSE